MCKVMDAICIALHLAVKGSCVLRGFAWAVTPTKQWDRCGCKKIGRWQGPLLFRGLLQVADWPGFVFIEGNGERQGLKGNYSKIQLLDTGLFWK